MIDLNEWESQFFGKKIGLLKEYSIDALSSENEFDLVQAKVSSDKYQYIKTLQQNGFHFIEGEIDFSLSLNQLAQDMLTLSKATYNDIPQLKQLVTNSFLHSRFKEPYFSTEDNQRFYQTWIENAVYGTFDDICFIAKQNNHIVGCVSVRRINNDECQIGLIAVSPRAQRQGIATKLLQSAIQWSIQQGAKNLRITTQTNNIAAINLYQKFSAKIHCTNYWFYKLIKR